MDFDFSPYFKEYEQLRQATDTIFERVQGEFPKEVKCKEFCADCCFALFDVTLIEALYLNHQFHLKFEDPHKSLIIEKANRADREVFKLKRTMVQDAKAGRHEEDIITEAGKVRIRCPLLNDEDRCDLYEFRPLTCRLYGIPTAIGGKGRTCSLSGFEAGKSYPSVNIDALQNKLLSISRRLAKDIGSRYSNLGDMLVPLSMALLTNYDEGYLGLKNPDTESDPASPPEEK